MSDRSHEAPPEERPLDPEQERLLDASLGLAAGVGLDGAAATEARALAVLVEQTRRELRGEAADPARVSEVRAAARAEAQLERATSGGFWRHLQGGLQRSPLIRVAAASLVVHLVALPVLAWIHLTAPPERAINIRFEQPTEPLTAEPEPELLEPVTLPQAQEDLDAEAPEPPR